MHTNLNTGAGVAVLAASAERARETVNDQLVVVYRRGRAARVYATAYTRADARRALRRCIAEYGLRRSARIVPALALGPRRP
jgi:hypothetical protein